MARDLGDFQTPLLLVEDILHQLSMKGWKWDRVIEPTCGKGNFIRGLLNLATPPKQIYGVEIQPTYVAIANQIVSEKNPSSFVSIRQQSVFQVDWQRDFSWSASGNLLILGNPPWVTSSELGALNSENLPQKRNLKALSGLEALMGSSNFDIAEYIILQLMTQFALESPTIAMLCKTSVARNVLQFANHHKLLITEAYLRQIDSKKWFNASVDACLLYVEMGKRKQCGDIAVYKDLLTETPSTYIRLKNDRVVSNSQQHESVKHVDGKSEFIWRQGIKHDAASVMELTQDINQQFINGLGEIVHVEDAYLYPLMKGSDIFHARVRTPRKFVIVPQKMLGEDTRQLEKSAPLLWAYLSKHMDVFSERKSSIYVGKSPFSIFGVGEYTFFPYKVAVAGLYKTPQFVMLVPIEEKPLILDDTCYFISCRSAQQAAFLAALLNMPLCTKFLESVIFADSKRPITKKILQRIDLAALVKHVDHDAVLAQANLELSKITSIKQTDWSLDLGDFLRPIASEHQQMTLFE